MLYLKSLLPINKTIYVLDLSNGKVRRTKFNSYYGVVNHVGLDKLENSSRLYKELYVQPYLDYYEIVDNFLINSWNNRIYYYNKDKLKELYVLYTMTKDQNGATDFFKMIVDLITVVTKI